MEHRPADVEATDIGKVFGDGRTTLVALESISFKVLRGSFLSIVGPSGCGKTTLLRILADLIKPTSGHVFLDPERKKKGMAYVPQAPMLLPWRTLFQNAALGMELKKSLAPARLERLESKIHAFGLNGFETALPATLSGGMLQRVALIRALESDPEILFCDEPFSAMDFVARLRLNTDFKSMCRVQGITMILVTHNIEEAIFLGDEVLVLSGRPGRLVAKYSPKLSIDGHDAVKCRSSPEFRRLFQQIWNDLESVGG